MSVRKAISAAISGASLLVWTASAQASYTIPSQYQQVPITMVSSTTLDGHVNFIDIAGTRAYVVTTSGLNIFDISNPAAPVLLSDTPMGTDTSGVWVQGNVAYLTHYYTNQMSIWDVTNAAAPVELTSIATASQPYDVYATGSTAYVTALGGKTLDTYSAAELRTPAVSSALAVGRPDYAWVQGHYLYTANRLAGTVAGGGISIFDVTDPNHPVPVSTINLPEPIYSVAPYGSYVYGTGMQKSNIYVVDISNPAAPTLVRTVYVGFNSYLHPGPWDIRVVGSYAYVAESKWDWLGLFDLSDPTTPTQVGLAKTYNGVSPQYLDVTGSYVYVGAWQTDLLQVFRVG